MGHASRFGVRRPGSNGRSNRLMLAIWSVSIVALVAVLAPGSAIADASTQSADSVQILPWPASDTWENQTAAVQGCDPIVTDPVTATSCLLPFPDDFLTVHDATTSTGRRVDFPVSDMGRNIHGTPIDPTAWNRNDGFSPGSPIIVHVPGIDLAKTGVAPITDIGASVAAGSPIILLDVTTGRKVPYWGELDANDSDAGEQALLIHPAVDFGDGDHIVVALRQMRDGTGASITSNPIFADYRDHVTPPTTAEQDRVPHMEAIFTELAAHHVTRKNLYLTWDFTVASTQSLTGPMIHIRDDAFAKLGSGVPSFTVTSVTDYTTAQNASTARLVEGTFGVPNYLTGTGGPGATFNPGANGLPVQSTTNPIRLANFECTIPRAAASGGDLTSSTVYPAHGMLYGHGLLGSADEITDSVIENMGNEHDYVVCGTNWLGLSQNDIVVDAGILGNVSQFPTLPDRGQQGMLDFLYLGRLMDSPGGFDTDAAFEGGGAAPIIAPHDLAYYGNSQGGIQGGALTAVAQDYTRAVLGVPGMDYSVLLNRSVDFAPFLSILNTNYPDKLDQQIGFAVMQMLWDRSEMDGYAEHLTSDPLPGTPVHQVLLDEAFGDHQVANIATENEARTIGAEVHMPALAPGRSPDVVPFWGIRPLTSNAYTGSALFMWDSGSPPPPTTNTPPTAGNDPHGVPRAQPIVREQAAAFLLEGIVLNVCGTAPCTAVP
jgi:hypothetical protein